MDSDQYSADLDEEYNIALDRRPRRWLGLFAGLYVGIVLGIVSSNSVLQVGYWIKLGVVSSVVSWGLVFLVSTFGNLLGARFGVNASSIRPIIRTFIIIFFAALFIYLVAFFFQVEGPGYVLTLIPIILSISIYWTKAKSSSFGLVSILFVGSGIFLSSFKLFTMPVIIKPLLPIEFSENKGSGTKVLVFNLDESIAQKRLAEIIINENVEIVLLQGLNSNNDLSDTISDLGKSWNAYINPVNGNSTAILSKVEGKQEVFTTKNQNSTMMSFLINEKLVRFVSCESPSGRKSQQRRGAVDWILKEYRKEDQPVLVAGNFNFNPLMQWTFVSPIITDSIFYDRASWKALSLLGEVKGYSPFAIQPMRELNLCHEWMVASPDIEIVSYKMAEISISEGSAAVLTISLNKNDGEPKKD
ncbi:MAG: hypothetical protein CMO54_09580 [Verrucomicrobiales bacterium]|nr:hypothetical protein [Verrucomicrobiales bacterium]